MSNLRPDFDAIRRLMEELPRLLPLEQADRLISALEPLASAGDGTSLIKALDLIAESEQADRRHRELRAALGHGDGTLGYAPPPTPESMSSPGPLMVCPVKGCRTRRYLLERGERLVCKLHQGGEVLLVRASELKNR